MVLTVSAARDSWRMMWWLPDKAQARLVEIGEQEEAGADGALIRAVVRNAAGGTSRPVRRPPPPEPCHRRPTLVLPRTTVRSRNGMCPALVERPVSLADVVSMAMM